VTSIEVRVDIDGLVSLPGAGTTAATVFLPEQFMSPQGVILAFAGGGGLRQSWDLHVEGMSGYSAADYYVGRGFVFVTIDHAGVGDSTPLPDLDAVTYTNLAEADAATVEGVLARLREGIAPGVAPMPEIKTVGMGHSMGGLLVTAMQANHRCFDAVAILGWSNVHNRVPPMAEDGRQDWWLRWGDEPDAAWATRVNRQPAVIPLKGADMLSPGIVAREAALVDVPVFAGLGERDVTFWPNLEPTDYRSARDITLAVIPRMTHSHNTANTREELWSRVADWATAALARPPSTGITTVNSPGGS
jgi:pimeloyl-ACP methyl ester carboxylesterase